MMDVQTAKAQSGPQADRVHRWATFFSYLLILVMTGVLFIHIQEYRHVADAHPLNPHYQTEDKMFHCNDCHDYAEENCSDEVVRNRSCHDCHVRGDEAVSKLKYSSVLVLCTRCHDPDVFIAYEHDGTIQEMDLLRSHVYGMEMTDIIYPKTLPLGPTGGLSCITCHDPHMTDNRVHLLRLYRPANGQAESVLPLCLDCHHSNHLFQ